MLTQNNGVKYRPKTYNEFYGNQKVIKEIYGWIKNEKVPRCILLTGASGLGKTTLAKLLAATVNCEHLVKGQPCGQCEACLDDTAITYDCTKSTGREAMDSLVAGLNVRPFYKRTVVIVDEVQELSKAAMARLLTATEDDDSQVMWLICTNEPEKLPATLRSRLAKLEVKPITQDEFFDLVCGIAEAENIEISDAEIDQLYETHGHNLRDALNELSVRNGGEQELETEQMVDAVLLELLVAMLDFDVKGIVIATHKFKALSSVNLVESMVKIRTVIDFLLKWCADPKGTPWLPPVAKTMTTDKQIRAKLDVEAMMHLSLALCSAERHMKSIQLTPSAERSVFVSAVCLYLKDHDAQ